MISLASLLADVVTALQMCELFEHVSVVHTEEFSTDQFALKVRAQVSSECTFQVHIYHNRGHFDYAYQLFGTAPLIRWDNKEHFRELETQPHHFHNEHGLIEASPLVGDPSEDLPIVLQQLREFLQTGSVSR